MAIAENTALAGAASPDSITLTKTAPAQPSARGRLLDIADRLSGATSIVGVCAQAYEEQPYAAGALIEARHMLEQLGSDLHDIAHAGAGDPDSRPRAPEPVQLLECSDGVLAVPLGQAWRLTIESAGENLEVTRKIVSQVADLPRPMARKLLRQLPATVLSRCTAAHATYAAELFAAAGARVSVGEAP